MKLPALMTHTFCQSWLLELFLKQWELTWFSTRDYFFLRHLAKNHGRLFKWARVSCKDQHHVLRVCVVDTKDTANQFNELSSICVIWNFVYDIWIFRFQSNTIIKSSHSWIWHLRETDFYLYQYILQYTDNLGPYQLKILLRGLELLTVKTHLLHMSYYTNWLTHDFWTGTGGWEFDRSHGAGTSSPSHWQQVEEQAPKPVGWIMCFPLMTLVPIRKLC